MTSPEQHSQEESPEKKKRSIPHLIGSFILLLAGAALILGHNPNHSGK